MVDLAKKQAYIRASIFRSSAARHELEHLLKKADESVSLELKTTVGKCKPPKKWDPVTQSCK